MNISGLSDAVATVLRLRIHRGVPVAVVEDDRVRARQVDAHPAGARAENEAEVLGAVVEALHEGLAHLHLGGPVQPHVDIAVVVEEGLQDVQHAGHLGEDENAMTSAVEIPDRNIVFKKNEEIFYHFLDPELAILKHRFLSLRRLKFFFEICANLCTGTCPIYHTYLLAMMRIRIQGSGSYQCFQLPY